MKREGGLGTVLFMGTYPPRECGIATFTADLVNAIDRRLGKLVNTEIIAMNSNGSNIYNYPKKVSYEINDVDLNDYIEVAEKINRRDDVNLVCIQHEFGIFGGEWGDHLLMFLEIINKPVVVTFHSVLPQPNDKLIRVVRGIAKKAEEIVVMTKTGVDILRESYGLENNIVVVPHGVPTTKFENQAKAKEKIGYPDRKIISSFGMIGPGKGYEDVIHALPAVVKEFPDLLYLICGETHPIVRKNSGEQYRNSLIKLINKLGLEKNVKFYNKYLNLDEIIKYLKASDIYISAGQNPNQITSGTLVYAMGCGRAVISTPFIHARDVVTEKRGMLTKYGHPETFSNAIIELFRNPEKRKSMESHAYHETRDMTWSNVAFRYSQLFSKPLGIESEESRTLPTLNTSHLMRLTDEFGIIQFSNQWIPDPFSGYTLDDNARALLVCTKHYEKFREYKQLNLMSIYLNYIRYVQGVDGKLYNFVDKEKKIDPNSWSEDAHGRGIWALSYMAASPHIPLDFRKEALEILARANGTAADVRSPRAVSFVVQGLHYQLEIVPSERVQAMMNRYANHLVELYEENSTRDWKWFEKSLTYANSKIPESLFLAYLSTHKKRYLEVANESLKFLVEKTFENNIFVPVGQNGWLTSEGTRSYYDRQPIEAAYIVDALILAYKVTRDESYRKRAFQAFKWFTGENTLKQVVYNETTGGCHDGLGERTININQGAESTLAYLMARVSMMDI